MDKLYRQIAALAKTFGADRAVLFGSRARGDNRDRSDIDIAVFGMPEKTQGAFLDAVEDLPTLLDFDVVFVADYTSTELLENIEKDGVELMNKAQDKLEKLGRAVQRLEEAFQDYDHYHIESLKDAIIQRFSFCCELAWKAAREVLLDQGYLDIDAPKSVMRKAYAAGLVSDEQGWIDLLQARNLAAHVYNEETAQEIFTQIRECFLPLMKALILQLNRIDSTSKAGD